MSDRPLAAPGLVSYRCRSPYGWIMIGARDDDEAMREARRSSDQVDRLTLERWDGARYMPRQLVAAATGHRWEGLGIKRSVWADQRLEGIAHSFLQQLAPDVAISGMALGWDQAFARAALMLGIPLVAAVPAGQVERWRQPDRDEHARLIARAAHVETIGEGYAFARAADLRNRWMMDRAHVVAALWSGQPSGTGRAVAYAQRLHLPIVNLWGLQHR